MESLIKKINLYIPKEENLPEGFSQLSPEETLVVLRTGYDAFLGAKSGIISLTNEEVYEEIRRELSETHVQEMGDILGKMRKLETDLAVQQELYKTYTQEEDDKIERQVAKRLAIQQDAFDRLQKSYIMEREQVQGKMMDLDSEIFRLKELQKWSNVEKGEKIKEEAVQLVHRELETMRAILSEKDKQNENMKCVFEKAVEKIDGITQKRSVVSIGKMGEHQFKDIAAQAFRDFDGFELSDVHSVGGQGDFHLKFRDFVVLADSKLYSNKVNSTSRDKIKRDLKKNDHIHFAWLVSLDTMIDKFDKAPFMFEWLSDKKCICYVNQLLKYEEPGEILRAVWYCCNTLYGIMVGGEGDMNEIGKLRERELKIRELAQKMVKNCRERETIMTQFRSNFDKNDEYIREILDGETNQMVSESFGIVVSWWNANMEQCDESDGERIKSTAIWTQFKKTLGSDGAGTNMDANAFKDILCSFLHESKVVKPKTKAGALEIIGYRCKVGKDGIADKTNGPSEKGNNVAPKIKVVMNHST